MQTDLRLLLVIIGLVLGALILFRSIRNKRPPSRFDETMSDDESITSEDEIQISQTDPLLEQSKAEKLQPKVISLTIVSTHGYPLLGEDLIQVLESEGFCYSSAKIFQRHYQDEPTQPVMYSVASMVEPGTFDYQNMPFETYRGIVMWMVLPTDNAVDVFEEMLNDAKVLTQRLHATLCDNKREPLSHPAIYAIRNVISEYPASQLG